MKLVPMMIFAAWSFQLQAISLVPVSDIHGPNGAALEGTLSNSEIEYEADGGGERSAKRTIIGATFSKSIASNLDLLGQVGWFSGDSQGFDTRGWVFGGGLRAGVYQEGSNKLIGYGIFSYLSEHLENSSWDFKMSEIEIGLVAQRLIQPGFAVFGGVDVVPYSRGGLVLNDLEIDFERSSLIGINCGIFVDLGNIRSQLELAFLNEETLKFSLGTIF